ncbi:hypothetical protein [Methylobacterium platani]|uniref:Uncharacterized protein n=2 Tax=Methylobacterium platani TaxID=427683 RepID=A0A179S6N3_9HYPH|nr:hypothetical protein [Methylobacterium platani]KMO22314.1 hypothetical protein SQ03_00910 [Methylobacterium platani JCM 14648]OAS22547.1 hypothetical protein A5481_19330 [Methylobacterium platani]
MRQQHHQAIPAVIDALDRDEIRLRQGGKVDRAIGVIEALGEAGFEIVRKPQPAPAVIMMQVRHADGSVSGQFSVPMETETEKAARWASVLIAQVLEDGTARQAEAGVDVAATEALLRLRRGRDRVAFEDVDRNPPLGACHASDLFAGWAKSLGDKVEWCEARLLPRRLVLTAVLHREPSQEQRADLDWRLKFLGQMGGVVGTSVNASVNLGTGAAQVEVEVRFAHYITTVGCEYTPGDLPARPARKAA